MFTMAEFIKAHGLNVDVKNPQATRIIARRLRELGYTSRTVWKDGVRGSRWAKEWPDSSSLEQLKAAVDQIVV